MNQQYSVTLPHPKHTKLVSRDLQSTLSSKAKHKKHFQLHLQNCQSLRFQTAESCFQAISSVDEQNLKNGYTSDVGINDQTCRIDRRLKRKKRNKTDRSLGDFRFQGDMENYVQLEYPQLFLTPQRNEGFKSTICTEVSAPSPMNRKNVNEIKDFSSENVEFMPEIVLDVR